MNENLVEHINSREKEITLISGQTGSGKTSVTVQWALDFCMQGLRVGYFSQEIDLEHLLGNYVIPQLEILSGNSAEITALTVISPKDSAHEINHVVYTPYQTRKTEKVCGSKHQKKENSNCVTENQSENSEKTVRKP